MHVVAAEPPVRYEASHSAMGTVFTLAAYGRDADYLAAVVNEVFEEIDRLDAQMSNYKPESELSGINREAGSRGVVVEPKLFRLLQECALYSEETNGAFDVTVGPLMKAWGFFRGQGRVPDGAEIERILQRVGYGHVRLDPATRNVRFDSNGVELDLGAIAKGYAVDQAVAILRARGVTSALISSGTSSLCALGAPPEQRAWKVTLRDPYDAGKPGDIIYLKNHSISVSGSCERFFKLGGKVYSHIMDPRTGRPAENILATAVLGAETTRTDALSTAFFVLRVEGSRKYLLTHANLTALFYLPKPPARDYQRVVVRSPSYALPAEAVCEIEEKQTSAATESRACQRPRAAIEAAGAEAAAGKSPAEPMNNFPRRRT